MQKPVLSLVEQLKSSDPQVREAAIRQLRGPLDPAALDALKQIQANDANPALRQLASQLIQQAAAPAPKRANPPGEQHYQMLWDCKFCGTKKLLAVDARHCPNCGSAQDPEWRYFPSEADKKLISDPNYIYAGVDKLCPFCGQPNSAAAKFCKDCGGDLANAKQAAVKDKVVTGFGQDVAGVAEDVVLKHAQQQQAALKPQKKGLSRTQVILLGIGALVVVIAAVVAFLALSKHNTQVAVSNLSWERVINVEQYTVQHQSNWQDSVPIDAYSRSCYAKDRPHEETYTENCGVERVDNGDGSFSEREKTCTKSRTVYQPDTYCDYAVNRWVAITPLTTSGGPNDPLVWPNFVSSSSNNIGAQRESSRKETLNVLFKVVTPANSSQTYTYNPPSQDKWLAFKPGQQFDLLVNGLNIPDWNSLKSNRAQ